MSDTLKKRSLFWLVCLAHSGLGPTEEPWRKGLVVGGAALLTARKQRRGGAGRREPFRAGAPPAITSPSQAYLPAPHPATAPCESLTLQKPHLGASEVLGNPELQPVTPT